MSKKYICVAKCPELDETLSLHCVVTLEQRREREDIFQDYCPCGNVDIWEEIKE